MVGKGTAANSERSLGGTTTARGSRFKHILILGVITINTRGIIAISRGDSSQLVPTNWWEAGDQLRISGHHSDRHNRQQIFSPQVTKRGLGRLEGGVLG